MGRPTADLQYNHDIKPGEQNSSIFICKKLRVKFAFLRSQEKRKCSSKQLKLQVSVRVQNESKYFAEFLVIEDWVSAGF